MELSRGSITGITIAIIVILIASFGAFIYLRRRRHRQRRAANTVADAAVAAAAAAAATTTSTSATTGNTTPLSHKNNVPESHVLQPRNLLPSGLKKHNAQGSEAGNLNLGNGFGAAPTTATVSRRMRNSAPSDLQGLTPNKTTFPDLDVPTTIIAEPMSFDDGAARDGLYSTDTMEGTRSTAAARLTADFGVELEQQPHLAFSDRPSSLHQAVLEVGGKDEETEEVDRTSRVPEPKREDSDNNPVQDVSTRPTGYTGAWP